MNGTLAPYPVSIPSDTFARVIAIFTGSPIVVEDAHYIWHVAGYALGQWDVHPTMRSAAPAFATKEAAAAELQKAFPDGKVEEAKAGTRAAVGFNWMALLPILTTLLQELFKK